AINHFDTRLALRAEREFLRLLEADCNQPVGVLAMIEGATMNMRAQIFAVGATTPREAFVEGRSEDAEKLAVELLKKINGEQDEEEERGRSTSYWSEKRRSGCGQ